MPVDFTCPHCGAKTQIADEHLGQADSCASCGRTITIPASDRETASHSREKSFIPPPAVWGIVLASGIAVSAILLAIILPTVQASREARRKALCMAHLKMISTALLAYEYDYLHLPPAHTVDEDGKPLHSWRVLILPYLEHSDLYEQIRLDEPWDSPHNSAFHDKMPPIFRCPSHPLDPNRNDTDYLMITGPGTVGGNPRGTETPDIADGTSRTLLVTESAGSGVHWMQPVDLDITTMPRTITGPGEATSTPSISSFHPGGANAAFCDNSVRFLPADTNPNVIEAMLTTNGDEDVDPNDH